MTPPHLQDLAADMAKLVLGWAPTHEPTHELLKRALAQADPHGRAYRVSAASPAGLVVERLAAGWADTWILRAGDGGLDVLRVRGMETGGGGARVVGAAVDAVPFADLWSEP